MFLLTLIALCCYVMTKKLFVYEHFRHGHRGPCDGLDENNNDYLRIHWDTLGELSPMGMRMHYLLGYRNRLRFKGFISDTYDARELYVISTDVNRTIHSAISHLQGMYPPSTGPTLTDAQITRAKPPNDLTAISDHIKNLGTKALPEKMQTIPFHIFFQGNHDFQLHEVGNCDKIVSTREENRKKLKVTKAAETFHNVYFQQFNEVYKYSNPNQLLNWTYDNYWCDHFISDVTEGRDLSVFTKVKINLEAMTDFCHEVLRIQLFEVVFGDLGEEIAKMSMSRPMRKILAYMNLRIALDQKGTPDVKDYSAPRFVIHSGHDTTLGAMQVFLKTAFDVKIVNPKYASNLYLELIKKDTELKGDLSDYYVDYYFEDTLLKTIPYPTFNKSIHDLLWEDKKIDEFCGFSQPLAEPESQLAFWISIGVLGAVIVALSAVVIWLCLSLRKEHHKKDDTLPVLRASSI